MKHQFLFVTVAASLIGLVAGAQEVWAQTPEEGGGGTSGGIRSNMPLVSLDVRDAPIRSVLEQLFKDAKIDYALDPGVSGYVTMRVTNQPFESVLRLVMRSATIPLNYTRESGVYFIKLRGAISPLPSTPPPSAPIVAADTASLSGKPYAVIHLNYIDPYDLSKLLNLTMIPFFARGNGWGNGGTGGTMGAPQGGSPGTGGLGGLSGGSGIGFDNTIIYFPPDGSGNTGNGGTPGTPPGKP